MNIFLQKKPFYISGPCSVETENQLIETAQRLKATVRLTCLEEEFGSQERVLEVLKELVKKAYHGWFKLEALQVYLLSQK